MDGVAIKAMMAEIAPVIRDYVVEQTAPVIAENKVLVERVAALEARKLERGEPGERGIGIERAEKRGGVLIFRLTDGSEIDVGNVDGEPGSTPDTSEMLAEFQEAAKVWIDEAANVKIAGMPLPEKGDTGEPGQDGCGITDLLMDHDGNLVASFDDGRMKTVGLVRGKDGEPGRDGRDGIDGKDGIDGGMSDDEKVALAAVTLREAIEAEPLVELPPVPARAEKAQPIIVNVENHIPRKGTERTVVTKHDERGRIAEFERQEIGE